MSYKCTAKWKSLHCYTLLICYISQGVVKICAHEDVSPRETMYYGRKKMEHRGSAHWELLQCSLPCSALSCRLPWSPQKGVHSWGSFSAFISLSGKALKLRGKKSQTTVKTPFPLVFCVNNVLRYFFYSFASPERLSKSPVLLCDE